MSKNRLPALALVLTAVALSGCGGSDDPGVAVPEKTPGTDATATQATPKPRKKPPASPVKSSEKDPVLAAILTRADLPGYEASLRTPTPEDVQVEREVYECLGLGTPSFRAGTPGLTFAKGELDVESSAAEFAAASRATRVARALDSAKSDACFEKSLTALFAADTEPSASSTLEVAVDRPATRVAGADRAWLQRVVVTSSGEKATARITVYQLRALVGRTLITLRLSDTGGTPAPSEAVRWAGKLVARVKAAATP